jgi:hypothetical protein
MAVVGYDFGNLNSYIAVARQGGIDVITNDYSLHATPYANSNGEVSVYYLVKRLLQIVRRVHPSITHHGVRGATTSQHELQEHGTQLQTLARAQVQ